MHQTFNNRQKGVEEMHLKNLKKWLDGEYVSPKEFKESLTVIVKQIDEYECYFEENSVEAIEKKMEPYYEEMAKLMEED